MSKKPRLSAACIVVDPTGKVLLGRRNKVNAHNRWVLPGGGVDFGESTERAAVREIKEETGLDVEIEKLVGAKEIINVPGEYHAVVFFYLARPQSTIITVTDDISEAKYFSVDEIKDLDYVQSVEWALTEAGLWL